MSESVKSVAPASEPWPYQANRPARFAAKYETYLAGGGIVQLQDDVKGFTAGGANRGDMARFYMFS
jgi:hypothetical protein